MPDADPTAARQGSAGRGRGLLLRFRPAAGAAPRYGWTAAFLLALAVTVLPVALTAVPPILDYPNHLARLWLLQGGIDDPFLRRVYAIDWHHASTNILIDLVAVLTRGVVPTSLLGPALLASALLLPALGMAALARVVHGRLGWWQLSAVILVWTHAFLLGFLNFQLALGLALLAAAGDERLRRAGSRWALPWRCAGGGVLLASHAFGLLFYAALVGGLAIGAKRPSGPGRWRRAAWRALAAVLPLVAIVALFWAMAAQPADVRAGPPSPIRWQSRWIVGTGAVLLDALKGYRPAIDLGFAAAVLLLALVAWSRRRLDAHAGLCIAGLGLLAGALVMPRYMLGSAYLELRLPTMAWFAFVAAVSPRLAVAGVAGRCATALALLLVVARAAWFGAVWHERDRDVAALRRVLAAIPPGARVLPLVHAPDSAQAKRMPIGRALGRQLTAWHLPTLAVMERHAFLPTLFASRGRHVLVVQPPFDRIAVAEGAIAPVDALARPLAPREAHEFGYVARWPCFDYVLVLDADVPNAGGPMAAPPQVILVRREGFAELYRVDHRGPARCDVPGMRPG